MERMKRAIKVNSDKELADFLGVSKSTVSSWRRRNTIPYAECVLLASQGYATLDWLVRGVDSERPSWGLHGSDIDYELLAVMVLQEEARDFWANIKDPWQRALMIAKNLVLNYEKYREILTNEVEQHGVSRDVFINHLKKAFNAFSKTATIEQD